MDGLEKKLDDVLGKNAPVKLPDNAKKSLADFMPWLSLIFGIIQLLVALGLYNWARTANSLADYASSVCSAFGNPGDCAATTRWSVWVYVALAVLAVDGVLLLMSYPGLKARVKKGWNLVFYSALLNLVYGVVSLFVDNRTSTISNLFWALVSSAVGLWLLFQIRPLYTGARVTPAGTTSAE